MFKLERTDSSILKSIKTIRKCFFGYSERGYENFDLFEIPTFVMRNRFPNHDKLKNNILSSIRDTPTSPSKFHTLKNHDWDVPPNVERKYAEFFIPSFLEVAKPFIEKHSLPRYQYWFNQYEPGQDECFIHVHQNSVISGVYFVELERQKDSTIFVSPDARKGYQIPVKEGDILFWNSMLPHLAPKTKGMKTIISFNLLT